MSTILDRAREGCLSVCVPLSVRSSRRQQGAPFQFTHQPQRRGVKARGIAVGDFTFEGQDYQSGDPCEEVMREGDRRGAAGVDGGVARGRAVRLGAPLPGIRGAVFSGERICQAAHLFDTRRCGVAFRDRLYPLSSPSCPSESRSLNPDYRKVFFKPKLRAEAPEAALLIANGSPFVSAFSISTESTAETISTSLKG